MFTLPIISKWSGAEENLLEDLLLLQPPNDPNFTMEGHGNGSE